MSDSPTGSGPHPDTTEPRYGERIDPRPAPKYGEYAPPGWVSPVPPVEDPAPQDPEGRPVTGVTPAGRPDAFRGYDAPPPTGAPVPGPPPVPASTGSFNRLATIALLAFGLVNVISSLFSTSTFASSLLTEMRQFGYPLAHFQSEGTLHTVGSVSAVAGLVIYLVIAVWSMRRLRAGRMSWLVPLITGVAVNLLTAIVVITVIMNDPSFSAYMQSSAG
ncbi:MAG: hypothetical protein JWP75_1169 [Frondihabitans sp.]|nr:hypothetical protein [Frondihabitans sp.]